MKQRWGFTPLSGSEDEDDYDLCRAPDDDDFNGLFTPPSPSLSHAPFEPSSQLHAPAELSLVPQEAASAVQQAIFSDLMRRDHRGTLRKNFEGFLGVVLKEAQTSPGHCPFALTLFYLTRQGLTSDHCMPLFTDEDFCEAALLVGEAYGCGRQSRSKFVSAMQTLTGDTISPFRLSAQQPVDKTQMYYLSLQLGADMTQVFAGDKTVSRDSKSAFSFCIVRKILERGATFGKNALAQVGDAHKKRKKGQPYTSKAHVALFLSKLEFRSRTQISLGSSLVALWQNVGGPLHRGAQPPKPKKVDEGDDEAIVVAESTLNYCVSQRKPYIRPVHYALAQNGVIGAVSWIRDRIRASAGANSAASFSVPPIPRDPSAVTFKMGGGEKGEYSYTLTDWKQGGGPRFSQGEFLYLLRSFGENNDSVLVCEPHICRSLACLEGAREDKDLNKELTSDDKQVIVLPYFTLEGGFAAILVLKGVSALVVVDHQSSLTSDLAPVASCLEEYFAKSGGQKLYTDVDAITFVLSYLRSPSPMARAINKNHSVGEFMCGEGETLAYAHDKLVLNKPVQKPVARKKNNSRSRSRPAANKASVSPPPSSSSSFQPLYGHLAGLRPDAGVSGHRRAEGAGEQRLVSGGADAAQLQQRAAGHAAGDQRPAPSSDRCRLRDGG